MTEQKEKLSKLCVSGFILSVLPAVLGVGIFIWWLIEKSDSGISIALTSVIVLAPIVMIALSIIGLCLSISGVNIAKIEGKKGKRLGIAGITFSVLYFVAVVVMIGLFVASIVKGKQKASMNRQQSDIYNMGTLRDYENTEYDVSEYRIFEGYEIDSSDITVSESELKAYAGSRLDTISKENDIYIKGTYNSFTFLIIRRDCYKEWDASEPFGSHSFCDHGYAQIYYDYQWEVSGFYTCYLDMYKDPSDKFIIITNCYDYKMITEFFENT